MVGARTSRSYNSISFQEKMTSVEPRVNCVPKLLFLNTGKEIHHPTQSTIIDSCDYYDRTCCVYVELSKTIL